MLCFNPTPTTGRISQRQIPQLSVDGAIHGEPCFLMVFPLLDYFPVFIYTLEILFDIFLNALSFVQDSGIHTHQILTAFFSTGILDLGCEFPCIVKSFIVFTSAAPMSSFI